MTPVKGTKALLGAGLFAFGIFWLLVPAPGTIPMCAAGTVLMVNNSRRAQRALYNWRCKHVWLNTLFEKSQKFLSWSGRILHERIPDPKIGGWLRKEFENMRRTIEEKTDPAIAPPPEPVRRTRATGLGLAASSPKARQAFRPAVLGSLSGLALRAASNDAGPAGSKQRPTMPVYRDFEAA